jgi:predicted nucleic acid-binding protein
VGGKTYLFEIVYYDDESNIARSNNLITRLILHDGIEYIILPYNLELNDNVKDLIKKYNVTTTLSKKAIFRYKDAFEIVNSFDTKKINIYLQNN